MHILAGYKLSQRKWSFLDRLFVPLFNDASIAGWQRDNRHRTPPTSPASAWKSNSSALRSGRRSFGRGWGSCRREALSDRLPSLMVASRLSVPLAADSSAPCPPRRASAFLRLRKRGGRSRRASWPLPPRTRLQAKPFHCSEGETRTPAEGHKDAKTEDEGVEHVRVAWADSPSAFTTADRYQSPIATPQRRAMRTTRWAAHHEVTLGAAANQSARRS